MNTVVKEILCKITKNLQVYPKGTCVSTQIPKRTSFSIQIKDLMKNCRQRFDEKLADDVQSLQAVFVWYCLK